MKKTQLLISAIALVAVFASCHRRSHITTISTSNNNNYKKVEYAGTISFSNDKASIQSMAPRSYLKYETNNVELVAESDKKGVITYEFYGNKLTQLPDEGKQILAEAIKLINEQQAKQKPTYDL